MGINAYSKVNIKYFKSLAYDSITEKNPYFNNKKFKISIGFVEKFTQLLQGLLRD
jgi:hypothetical protein